MNVRTALAAIIWAAASVAHAQEQAEIIVRGEPLREASRDFTETLSAPIAADNQIARWAASVCIGVAGMRATQGQALIDRIAHRALQAGIEVGGSGCSPNVLIFYAADSDSFARELLDREPTLFGYFHEENINTLGRGALEEFITSQRAVRSWHVTRRSTAAGFQIGSGSARPMASGGAGSDGFDNVQVIDSQGTRLRQAIRQDFLRAIIIIDGRRTQGFTLNAVADFAAMAALAQLDAHANTRGRQTILNLFTEEPAPAGMTDWDIAYLQGLYGMTHEAASARQQINEVSARMTRELSTD